jgi:O-antigen/teichoic acid export membrane protein
MHLPQDTPSNDTSQYSGQHLSGIRRMVNATGILLAAQILGAGLQLLALRTVQNTLSKAANGEFYWVQQVSMFAFFTFVEMGMNAVATRLVVQNEHRKERIIATFFKVRLLLWCVASLCLGLYAWAVVPDALAQLSIYAVFSLLGARSLLLRSVLEVSQRARNLPLLPALSGVLDVALFAVCTIADPVPLTPMRVMAWLLVSAVPGFCIMLAAEGQWKWLWKYRLDTGIARELFRETLPMLVSTILLQIQATCDTFILDAFCGKEAVGIYGAAMRLAAQGTILLMILPTVISPAVSALRASNDERFKTYITEGLVLTLLIAILFASGITVLAEPMIFLTAGRQYISYTTEFALAAWSLTGSMMVAYTLALFIAIGEQRRLYAMFWVLSISSVAANLVLTPLWGAMGALVARILATTVSGLVGVAILAGVVGKKLAWQGVVRVLVVVAIVAPAAFFLPNIIILPNTPVIVRYIITGISICAVFGLACFMAGLFSKREMTWFRSLVRR